MKIVSREEFLTLPAGTVALCQMGYDGFYLNGGEKLVSNDAALSSVHTMPVEKVHHYDTLNVLERDDLLKLRSIIDRALNVAGGSR